MSNNPKGCPYFIGMSRQKITCKGIVAGSEIHQAFREAGMEKAYHAEFCSNAYHRCTAATMINAVWNGYAVQPCPHNSGVECLHQSDCDSCGWNPLVAEERLRRFYIRYSLEIDLKASNRQSKVVQKYDKSWAKM